MNHVGLSGFHVSSRALRTAVRGSRRARGSSGASQAKASQARAVLRSS